MVKVSPTGPNFEEEISDVKHEQTMRDHDDRTSWSNINSRIA